MEKIGLYNLQPKYQNYALEKIRKYYSDKGSTVLDCSPVEAINFDTVYASSIFEWTRQDYVSPDMITGGTGFNLTTTLPPEIEAVEPHLNFGFCSRGCPNKCPFCVVPEKEGKVRPVGDLRTIWDGKSKLVTLYDNNILALPDHFELICSQARQNNITLDFNQGLDHRRLTPEIVEILKITPHKEYHFAFDNPAYITGVDRAISLLESGCIKRSTWYVLVGFNTTPAQDMFRIHHLKARNQNVFVQKFRGENSKLKPIHTPMARWANNHAWFHGVTFQQFLDRPENNYRF